MNQFKIPILLINYNRPDLSERVLEKVLQVNPGKLYISIDGPNLNKPNDEKKVMLTRNLFNNLTIKGQQFKLFHKKNLGCKEAIQTAINWF